MISLTALLLAAAIGLGASRWLGVPGIPLLIVAGLVASRIAPIPEDFLGDALMLGVTVMVFVAGIELSPRRVGPHRRGAALVGSVQFVVLGGLGLGVALLLGMELETAAYLALALTASSTLVVVRILQVQRQLFEPLGRLVTGVLLLQDILVVLLIPVVIRLPDGAAAVGMGVLSTLALVGLSAIVLRWIAPFAVQRLAFDEESLLLVVLTILFGFLGLTYLFDLPLVAGAFLAGLALSGFPVSALVRGQLNSLSDFFNAIFFTALGAFVVLPTAEQLLHALAFIGVVVLLTPPLVAYCAERVGYSARPALAAGLLLAQTSEFSLVVALQGVLVGQLDAGVFTVIALVTVVSMMLTPFLATDRVTWALVKAHPFKRSDTFDQPPEDHVLLLGCGRSGISLLEMLVVTANRVVVVDDDPALVQSVREANIPALRGDVSDIEVLRSAGADRAKIVVSTIRRKEDNSPLLALAKDRRALIRAFNLEDGEWIRSRGGEPILYSEAAAEEFLAWFREEWSPDHGDASGNPSGGAPADAPANRAGS